MEKGNRRDKDEERLKEVGGKEKRVSKPELFE